MKIFPESTAITISYFSDLLQSYKQLETELVEMTLQWDWLWIKALCYFFILPSQFFGTQRLKRDKTPKLGFNAKSNFQGIVVWNVLSYIKGGFIRKY